MEQNVYEYSVICPECRTKTVLVIVDTGLTLFSCGSCTSNIMLYKNKLFTLRKNFLESILKNYRLEECGKVVYTRKPKGPSEFITAEKISDLKKKLDESFYLEDFLKNM